MRSHDQIVREAKPERLVELTGVSIHTARSWIQRNSIPAEHWAAVAGEGIATLDELAAAAAAKREITQVAA